MRIKLGDLRKLISELVDPSGGWRYFHITPNDRGPTFTFTPQTPAWNRYTQAEDFTTPRVSLATSVEAAVHGKFGSLNLGSFGQSEMFVYACKRVPKLFFPQTGDDLGSPDNPWGPDWSYKRYAETHGLDPNDKAEHAKVVRGLITDDPKVTKEVWSLSPIRMVLVGRIWLDDPHNPKRLNQKYKFRVADLDDEEEA